jgi:hypothetical protein
MIAGIRIGTKGHAVRTDCGYPAPAVSRELVIYYETRAFWVAHAVGRPTGVKWWFWKRDLAGYPKLLFPTQFQPSDQS